MSLLNDASLVLIPSGYKEDKVYSIIPSDGSGDLDFVRGGSGTRINSLGQVENVCWNLFTYSEDFTNADWNKDSSTINSNVVSAPNGTTTADKLNENSSTNIHSVYNLFTGSGVNTISVYAKKAERDYICLYSGGGTIGGYFDINNGTTLTTFGGAISSIQNVGNGWYRCSITFTLSTLAYAFIATSNNGSTLSYAGTTGSGVYIWGAQANAGALKPYFPTTDRLNVPRLTYENGCPSLLLEKQSTNLALWSEQIDNAAWAKTRATITANSTVSPDGTVNADLLSDTTFTNSVNYTELLTSVSSSQVTLSIFVKKGTAPYIGFGFYDNAYHGFVVDTTNYNVTYTFGSAANFTKQNIGNDWYRLSMTKTASTNFIFSAISVQQNSDGSNYNGTGSLNAYFWGAQLEQSSYPTSYIPTTSATATRLADSCSKTGISSLIGQTEGSILLDLKLNAAQESILFDITNGSLAPQNRIILYTPGDLSIFLVVFDNNTNTVQIQSSPYSINQRLKIGVAYKINDTALYINGTQIGIDTSCSIPTVTLSRIDLGNRLDGTYPSMISVNQALLFKRRLTNTELTNLTTL